MSGASATGFTVSGTWRQQFDWAVIEWNRDNVYEHPAFRNLPDGDLSGLVLTYEETRTNCIPLDSDLFPTVDWPYLRVWAGDDPASRSVLCGGEGSCDGDRGKLSIGVRGFHAFRNGGSGRVRWLGLSGLQLHVSSGLGDTLNDIVTAIAGGMNGPTSPFSPRRKRERRSACCIRSTAGANGNRFGIYSSTSGSATWDAAAKTLANGTSPTKWQVTIDFSSSGRPERDERSDQQSPQTALDLCGGLADGRFWA